ncbi:Isochorismatase hydrolase [Hysterangium stoloniferum]|nr:Isochorismatase hydrolase [Hysterangium stoloniferum]
MSFGTLPLLKQVKTFGNVAHGTFWVEYPSGLLDLTRSRPPAAATSEPPAKEGGHLEFEVDGNRKVRIDPTQSAIVIVDMQNFFLHPELLDHPTGLACVDPLMRLLPFLREKGVRIIWLNWGLTEKELKTLPPVLIRSFTKEGEGGFGCDLGGNWGPALMRGAANSDLYGPLHDEWLKGEKAGTDVWFHKNRVGGLWGPGTAAGLYLKEEGINTLLFAGVNTDQCVLGTLIDAYFGGYDNILIKDAAATTTPSHGQSNVIYNTQSLFGFVTGSENILKST